MWGRDLVWAELTVCGLRYVWYVFSSGTRASLGRQARSRVYLVRGVFGSRSIVFKVICLQAHLPCSPFAMQPFCLAAYSPCSPFAFELFFA